MVVNIAAMNERNPLAVVKHKSANECSSDTSTLRSEPGLRPPTDGDFLWIGAFIKSGSLQSIVQRAESMPDPETRPKLLISSKFSKELTICRTANLRVKFRELV